ncbi:MAG: FtsX-like permease family protein [Tissierellia bacterium]|nr:FtsX-like permease family protein [Tissierellia bacterium]
MVLLQGADIRYLSGDGRRGSFADSLLDNYFVLQNEELDFLLDAENHSVAQVGPGELALPVLYAQKYGLSRGDQITLKVGDFEGDFTIVSLIRDSQMGSSLASSIRFVLSPEDFQALEASGAPQESIIAFTLDDPAQASKLQSAYTAEEVQLPQNGIGLTISLIRLVNGIGDGLMSGMIILVSLILIGISLLNVRFTLLSTLEEEVREIGTLRALGLKHGDIEGLYRAKYLVMAAAACILGALVSFPLSELFLGNIALNFGLKDRGLFSYIFPFLSVALVFLLVFLGLKLFLRRMGKVSVLDALLGTGISAQRKREAERAARPLRMWGERTDLSLSLHLFWQSFSSWRLMILVFFLASLVILLPLNLYTTLKSPSFIEYMGAAQSDLRLGLSGTGDLQGELEKIAQTLKGDQRVAQFNGFSNYRAQVMGPEGTEGILVESGDYGNFPIAMEEGSFPSGEGELAVSVLQGEHFGWTLGQEVSLNFEDGPRKFVITGIYQDITHGGRTAKTPATLQGDIQDSSFYVNLKDPRQAEEFALEYGKLFPSLRALPVEELVDQTLGTVTSSLRVAAVTIFVLALLITGLISILFITLLLHRNEAGHAILRALGFRVSSLRKLYLIQLLLAIFPGLCLAAVVALLAGPPLMGGIFALMGFGLGSLNFVISPLPFLLGILLPGLTGIFFTWTATKKLAQSSVMDLGNV